MDELMRAISEQITNHWMKAAVAGAFMLVGWFVGKRRARANWRKRQFYNRLNVSLNMLNDGTLKIRTIVEEPMKEVFLNQAAADLVVKAARQTTADDPLLPIPEADRWFVHNEVLNQLAERFCEGQIRQDLGMPVTGAMYIIGLTCEKAGDMRTHKVRAMMMRKDTLLNLPKEMPKFERRSHETRFRTLEQLAKRYHERPDDFIEMAIYQ